jgi:putative tryptophan/tyrosine transport system substrate-binding protein
MFFDFADFAGKWVELLKDVVPQLAHVTVLWDPGAGPVQLRAVEAAAHALGVQLHLLDVRAPDEIEGACRTAAAARAGPCWSCPPRSSTRISSGSRTVPWRTGSPP